MKEQLVSFETAKLAKEVGFNWATLFFFDWEGTLTKDSILYKQEPTIEDFLFYHNEYGDHTSAPTRSELQKFIRENRGVHIEIHRNAFGYYWSMCESNGGTDLGWSDHNGPNLGEVWDSFESALENALQLQLSYDLPDDIKTIKHWGNYAEFALKTIEKKK